MIKIFTDNNLNSPSQSGLRPVGSCINQPLSINHEILRAFNIELEVRGIFLDISKAFDKVWHERLIFKLCQNVSNILNEFYSNRKQRVILNVQCSSKADICSGVPQGSILGSLLFLTHINDLSVGFNSKCRLFADDSSLFSVVQKWSEQWLAKDIWLGIPMGNEIQSLC